MKKERITLKEWIQILPPLTLAFITRRKRVKVKKIEWSDKSWTHNLFRLWELIFWRKVGKSNNLGDTIRPHLSFWFDPTTGQSHINFHCAEAVIAHVEGQVREFVKAPVSYIKDVVKKDYTLVFFLPERILRFGAVAHSASNGAHNSTFTISSSGTNRILFGASIQGVNTPTYNTVSLTSLTNSSTGSPSFFTGARTWYLIAPDTGTNTYDTSAGSAPAAGSIYTGALQSAPGVSQVSSNADGTSVTGSLTTDVDNSWVWAGVNNKSTSSGSIQDAGTGSTQRAKSDGSSVQVSGSYDNGSAKTPVGAVSMTVTYSNINPNPAIIMAQHQVAPAAVVTFKGLALLGVGV